MVDAPAASPIRNCDPATPTCACTRGSATTTAQAVPATAPTMLRGPLRVLPPDPFDLDGNVNDETGCESGEADTPSLTSRSCACG
jgi:hypothetical protein